MGSLLAALGKGALKLAAKPFVMAWEFVTTRGATAAVKTAEEGAEVAGEAVIGRVGNFAGAAKEGAVHIHNHMAPATGAATWQGFKEGVRTRAWWGVGGAATGAAGIMGTQAYLDRREKEANSTGSALGDIVRDTGKSVSEGGWGGIISAAVLGLIGFVASAGSWLLAIPLALVGLLGGQHVFEAMASIGKKSEATNTNSTTASASAASEPEIEVPSGIPGRAQGAQHKNRPNTPQTTV